MQRRRKLKVKAQDVDGNPMSLSLTDWQARIFQHEYDHLQVVLNSMPHACGCARGWRVGMPPEGFRAIERGCLPALMPGDLLGWQGVNMLFLLCCCCRASCFTTG